MFFAGKIVVGSSVVDRRDRDPSDSAQRTYRFGMALVSAWEPVNRATEVGFIDPIVLHTSVELQTVAYVRALNYLPFSQFFGSKS